MKEEEKTDMTRHTSHGRGNAGDGRKRIGLDLIIPGSEAHMDLRISECIFYLYSDLNAWPKLTIFEFGFPVLLICLS